MTLAKLIARLTKGYIKETGKVPTGLDKLRIKMEAAEKLRQMNKVIQFPQQRSFKQEIESMINDGTIKMGQVDKMNDSVRTRNMFKDSNLNKPRVVKTEDQIREEIKANNKKFIQSLKDNLDDPEDFASGGIAGMLGERPRYQTGGDVAYDASDASIFGSSAISVTPETMMDGFGNQVQKEMGNTYNPPLIEDVIEEKNNIEQEGTLIPEQGEGRPIGGSSGITILSDGTVYNPGRPVVPPEQGGGKDLTKDPFEDRGPFNISAPGAGGDTMQTKEEFGRNKRFASAGDFDAAYQQYQQRFLTGNQAVAMPASPRRINTNASPLAQAALADGGIARAGFVGGGMGRRGFLKMLAGLGAGIGAAKTGILKFAGKEPVKQVTKEVVKQSASTPPPYFFKLAEKIKKLGDNTIPTNDRTIAKSLKSKDGKSNYILEEDVVSGDTIIKKVNKEGDEMITDVQIMELKKGEVVKGKDGRPVRTPDEYEEVTEANARIEGDVFNDPYYTDGIEIDEILKEVGEQAPSIKKASGGIARMLGE